MQSTAAVAIRLAAGSISQLIWEKNIKSRIPPAVQRSTKTETPKKLKKEAFQQFRDTLKTMGVCS